MSAHGRGSGRQPRTAGATCMRRAACGRKSVEVSTARRCFAARGTTERACAPKLPIPAAAVRCATWARASRPQLLHLRYPRRLVAPMRQTRLPAPTPAVICSVLLHVRLPLPTTLVSEWEVPQYRLHPSHTFMSSGIKRVQAPCVAMTLVLWALAMNADQMLSLRKRALTHVGGSCAAGVALDTSCPGKLISQYNVQSAISNQL